MRKNRWVSTENVSRLKSPPPFRLALLVLLPLFGVGCEAPGVGDPCDPESVPQGGFEPTESYLETSSVQCRTRVCIVYELDGVPNRDGTCENTAEARCASEQETEERVYCTCRCKAPSGNATTCECPDGFSCVDVLESEVAGPGIRGSYCVRSSTAPREE